MLLYLLKNKEHLQFGPLILVFQSVNHSLTHSLGTGYDMFKLHRKKFNNNNRTIFPQGIIQGKFPL